MSLSDFRARLPGPVTGRPRRPLSNSASTASCSIRFSLLTMISGAPRSSSRLRRLLRLMTRRYRSLRSDVALRVQVDLQEQVADRLGAHAAAEVLTPAVRRAEALLELAEQRLVVDDLLRRHRLEQLPDLAQPLGRVLDVGLGVRDVGLHDLLGVLEQLLAVLVGQLLRVDVEVLRPQVILVGEALLGARVEVLGPALE